MSKFSLQLSDGIHELRDSLAILAGKQKPITVAEATALDQTCVILEHLARELECEVSRHRWNELARKERQAAETVQLLEETKRAGSNVKLFPVIRRPIPRQQPNGAA